MLSQRAHVIFRTFLATAVALGLQAAPAQAQVRAVEQGAAVHVHGTGICTVGFNEPGRQRSLVAAHCGREGARVELVGGGAAGTLYRSKVYDGHLAQPLKCYDPYLEGRNVTPSQVDNFEEFLHSVDFVVIMVKHDHIKQHWQDLEGKIVLDCQNICPLPNVYKL